MSELILPDQPFMVPADKVAVTDKHLTVFWADGRIVSVPLEWHPRLVHGSALERVDVEFSDFGIHWPLLDEDISYKSLLMGWKSGESCESINRWLDYRSRGEQVPVLELPMPADMIEDVRQEQTADRRRTGYAIDLTRKRGGL